MNLITALVLVTIFAAVAAACLLLAPNDTAPLIDQVGQRIGAVMPVG